MRNVQLGSKEATKVFVELDTKRILGFGPEFAHPVFPLGTKWTEYTLLSAREIERWIRKYREQQQRDAEEATYTRLCREKRFRDALKSAIRARNPHVSQFNRDLNNVLIRLMDERYDKMMAAMEKPDVFGVAEAFEEQKSGEDLAMEHPYFNLKKVN